MNRAARIVIPYFGPWPEWMDLFLLSCRQNPHIDWLIVSDADPDQLRVRPGNVAFDRTSFPAYLDRMSDALGFPVGLAGPYKLCELKPALGLVHEADVAAYRYWGYGDLDVIYGDLGRMFTSRANVYSAHADFLSGPLCLLRNTPATRTAFRKIPNYRQVVTDPEFHGADEWAFTRVFCRRFDRLGRPWNRILRRAWNRVHRLDLQERYTTPFLSIPWHDGTLGEDQPGDWAWEDGRLTCVRDGRESPYLHFMNFKSDRWRAVKGYPWQGLSRLVRFEVSDDTRRFFIGRAGFTAEPPSDMPWRA